MAIASFKSGLSKSPSIKCFKYDCTPDEIERAFGIEQGPAGRGKARQGKANQSIEESKDEEHKDQCDAEGNPADHVRSFCEHENGIITGGQSLSKGRNVDDTGEKYHVVSVGGKYGERNTKGHGEKMEIDMQSGFIVRGHRPA
jgi:hypothetical protein